MNRDDVQNGIRRSWSVVESLGLGESFSSPAPLVPSDEFKALALSEEAKYSDVYLSGLRTSSYNFVLIDYSYFQFGWSEQDSVRYAYLPNPFIGGERNIQNFRRHRKLLENGHITYEEYHALLADASPEVRVPLIRYENAPGQRKEFRHPCSHLHIGHHSDNRWALGRVVTPVAFCLLILKQYYAGEWSMYGDDDAVEFKNKLEGQLIAERQNCRVLGDDMFSANEARSFHFS